METKEAIKDKLKSVKVFGKDRFVIVVLVGVLLLIIAMPTSTNKKNDGVQSGLWDSKSDIISETITETENLSLEIETKGEIEEYEAHLENRLEQILTEIEGVGKVKVTVTVSTSKETVVQKDVPVVNSQTEEKDAQGGNRTVSEADSKEETVYHKTKDGASIPFVIKTIQPQVEGVLVVAQGGEQPLVSKNITEAIVALFQIEPNKIKVAKMKSK